MSQFALTADGHRRRLPLKGLTSIALGGGVQCSPAFVGMLVGSTASECGETKVENAHL